MARTPGMKCSNCGHWNRVRVNKIFVEPDSPEPKVRVLIPMYAPLQVLLCGSVTKVSQSVAGEKIFTLCRLSLSSLH